MNSFADSLLTMLLSWLRTLFSDILSLFNGTSVSFLSWMKNRWLTFAFILIIAGVTLDIIIYILRWHPQYVWRSWFQRLFRRNSDQLDETQFEEGYSEAVDNFTFAESAVPGIIDYATPISDALAQFDAVVPAEQLQTPPADIANVRRRRSDRYHRRGARNNRLLPRSGNDQDSRITSPVNPKEAFHNAVYPMDHSAKWPQNTNQQD